MAFLPTHIPLQEALSSFISEDQAGLLLQSQRHCNLYGTPEPPRVLAWPT